MKDIGLGEISMKTKVAIVVASLIMFAFFITQTLVVFEFIDHDEGHALDWFGYICIIGFMPPFGIVVHDFIKSRAMVISELKKKNTYLEHAAKIIRHDMHSGINTYLPRGIKALERKLTPEQIKEMRLEAPMKMLKEGLKHTRKTYNGVYEFTNLVKHDAVLQTDKHNIKHILEDYLKSTSYKSQVELHESLDFELAVNESLFCTAIDNLIRNGLKYNDSASKLVKVYRRGKYFIVEDNGRGMSQKELVKFSEAYVRKEGQKESGSGLGLNICTAILKEHGFYLTVQEINRTDSDFYDDLLEIEQSVNKNPDAYSFDRDSLIEKARAHGYRGRLRTMRGGRDRSKVYVFYDEAAKLNNKGTKIKIKFK